MNAYYWSGFIAIGVLVCSAGTFLWIKMLRKNKTLPEVLNKIKEKDEDDNFHSSSIGMR